MKKAFLIILAVILTSNLFSQDSLPPHLKGKVSYPAIALHPYMGVFDIKETALKYDPKLEYKVVIDVYDKIKDSTGIYVPFRESARTYNLNIANGVPQGKLKMAVVIHGFGLDAILNDSQYKEKYGVNNPNVEIIRALKDLGVHFYVCGQNLGMFNIPPEHINADIEVSISAKTAFITLDQMGYSYLNVNED
jgi:intracellular sulfur oxidation DsrE/DsrF family protein